MAILKAAIAPLGGGTGNSRAEPLIDGDFVGAGIVGRAGIAPANRHLQEVSV